VADLTLDKLILAEAARETSEPRASARLRRAHRAHELGCPSAAPAAVLGQHRSTQRKAPRGPTTRSADGRHHRAGPAVRPLRLPQDHGPAAGAGWLVNDKRVERIWRREGLKVPPRQPKRGRLWLADGSCIRLRPERANHVWAYDFVEDRTHDGRKFRMLNVIDEFTRECLAIRVGRKLKAADVIDVLSDLFILRGVPATSARTTGPEFVAKAVQGWITASAPRRPTSSPAARGRTATWRASTPSCATSCWTARSSTRCRGRGGDRAAGAGTTTPSARTPRWATARRRPRCPACQCHARPGRPAGAPRPWTAPAAAPSPVSFVRGRHRPDPRPGSGTGFR
jgi:hypothetical protein